MSRFSDLQIKPLGLLRLKSNAYLSIHSLEYNKIMVNKDNSPDGFIYKIKKVKILAKFRK